jgi:ribonuclease HI
MAKKNYYAVKQGASPGIYQTWAETEAQVKGYPGAKFKGFATETEARQWLEGKVGDKVASSATKKRVHTPVQPPKEGEITVYTDGGALNNPGPGGYGAILLLNDSRKELCGGYRLTTNNRMELMGCIAALRELRNCRENITVYSDSSYVVNGIAKGWARKWRGNGWIKSDKKPVINQDLWEELLRLTESLRVNFIWVKGHAGNELNERCDRLAVNSAKGENLQRDKGYEQL